MKRWVARWMIVLMILMTTPSLTVEAEETLTAYPLVSYSDCVKLLGGATLSDNGVTATNLLDGVAFYTDGNTVAVKASGQGAFCVFVDASHYGDVTLSPDGQLEIKDLSDGTHRVELFLASGQAVVTSIDVDGRIDDVPKTSRVMVFDTENMSVCDMVKAAQFVGMDCKTPTDESPDETVDVVVVDDGDEATFDARYPRARIVCVGEDAASFAYGCEPSELATYLRETAVPASYFEEVEAYVERSVRQISWRRPGGMLGDEFELEIRIAEQNDNISGVLASLHGRAVWGPMTALLPEIAEPGLFNSFILTAVLVAVAGMTLLVTAWVLILKKPKPTVSEEQKEESL